jgi:hypothetical protein
VPPGHALPIEPVMTKKIAYFINQYPKVSHSFIRREIRALEALGARVLSRTFSFPLF